LRSKTDTLKSIACVLCASVDGGIHANNPTLAGLKEAQALFPHRKIGCVVSLGCGYEPIGLAGRPVFKDSTTGPITITTEMATGAEAVHRDALREFGLSDDLGGVIDPGCTLPMWRNVFADGALYARLNPMLDFEWDDPATTVSADIPSALPAGIVSPLDACSEQERH
jgi:hypothetical protein